MAIALLLLATIAMAALHVAPPGAPAPRLWVFAATMLAASNADLVRATGLRLEVVLSIALAASVAAACVVNSHLGRWMGLITGAIITGSMCVLGWHWGHSGIDVFNITQGSTHALLHGVDPYRPAFRSTTPGLSTEHLPYFPGVLLIALPFSALGDVRVASAIGLVLQASCLIYLLHQGRRGTPLVPFIAILIALPFSTIVVWNAWPETYAVVLLVVWMTLGEARAKTRCVVLGLCMATVQTALVMVAPIAVWSATMRRDLLRAAIVCAAFTLPFVAWTGSFHFIRDTVGVPFGLPTRNDAITINALLHSMGRGYVPPWLAVVIVTAGAVLLLRIRPTDTASLLDSTALLLVVAFLFAKQAFPNQYLMPAVLLIVALVAGPEILDIAPPHLGRWPASVRFRRLSSIGMGSPTDG